MLKVLKRTALYDPLRPAAPQVKWWLVGGIVLLLAAWEVIDHLWLMALPMLDGHRVNALVAAALVAGTLLVCFSLLQAYEERLAAGAASVWRTDQRLLEQVVQREAKLASLAVSLNIAAQALAGPGEPPQAEGAGIDSPLSTPDARRSPATEVERIARSLNELVEEGRQLTNLPRSGWTRAGAYQQASQRVARARQ